MQHPELPIYITSIQIYAPAWIKNCGGRLWQFAVYFKIFGGPTCVWPASSSAHLPHRPINSSMWWPILLIELQWIVQFNGNSIYEARNILQSNISNMSIMHVCNSEFRYDCKLHVVCLLDNFRSAALAAPPLGSLVRHNDDNRILCGRQELELFNNK